jgi:hypothetical protein
LSVQNQHSQNSAKLDENFKGRYGRPLKIHQITCHNEMPGGRDRQKFRKAFEEAEDNSGKQLRHNLNFLPELYLIVYPLASLLRVLYDCRARRKAHFRRSRQL